MSNSQNGDNPSRPDFDQPEMVPIAAVTRAAASRGSENLPTRSNPQAVDPASGHWLSPINPVGEVRRLRTGNGAAQTELAQLNPSAATADCDELIALGKAKRQAGDQDAAEIALCEAAKLAEQCEDVARLIRIFLAFQCRHWPAPGEANPRALLLGRRLLAMRPEDAGRRAVVMSRTAAEAWYFTSQREYASQLAASALELVSDGDAHAQLYVRLFRDVLLREPEHSSERLANAVEIIRLGSAVGDYATYFLGSVAKSSALCILGELGHGYGVACAASATVPMSPSLLHQGIALSINASRAVMDGRFCDGCEEFGRVLEFAKPSGLAHLVDSCWPAMLLPLSEQGRLAEIENIAEDTVRRRPGALVYSALLSWLKLRLSRKQDAHFLVRHLAADDFAALAQSEAGWVGMAVLGDVCRDFEPRGWTAALYQRLAPYAGYNAALGVTAMFGSVERALGNLALAMGRVDDAVGHFERSFAHNCRMGARPWAAYARLGLAQALMMRAASDDLSRAAQALAEARSESEVLGLKSLLAKVHAAQQRAPLGSDPVVVQTCRRAQPFEPGETAGSAPAAVFRREGNYWRIGFEGRELSLRHVSGLPLIGFLLERAGEDFAAAELEPVNAAGDPAETRACSGNAILDAEARRSYRERLRDLALELEEARGHNDLGRASKLEQEQEFLNRELAGSVGLLGRERGFNSQSERTRKRVSMAIARAIAAIAAHDRALGRYLQRSINTGYLCNYTPDPRNPIRWRL